MQIKTEASLQQDVVIWFNNTYGLKHHNPRCVIFAVQNELVNQIAASIKAQLIEKKCPKWVISVIDNSVKIILSRAIATGLKAGVSDLIVLTPNKVRFWELKTLIGKQREKQIEFQKLVEGLGFEYKIIRTLDEAKNEIQDK